MNAMKTGCLTYDSVPQINIQVYSTILSGEKERSYSRSKKLSQIDLNSHLDQALCSGNIADAPDCTKKFKLLKANLFKVKYVYIYF